MQPWFHGHSSPSTASSRSRAGGHMDTSHKALPACSASLQSTSHAEARSGHRQRQLLHPGGLCWPGAAPVRAEHSAGAPVQGGQPGGCPAALPWPGEPGGLGPPLLPAQVRRGGGLGQHEDPVEPPAVLPPPSPAGGAPGTAGRVAVVPSRGQGEGGRAAVRGLRGARPARGQHRVPVALCPRQSHRAGRGGRGSHVPRHPCLWGPHPEDGHPLPGGGRGSPVPAPAPAAAGEPHGAPGAAGPDPEGADPAEGAMLLRVLGLRGRPPGGRLPSASQVPDPRRALDHAGQGALLLPGAAVPAGAAAAQLPWAAPAGPAEPAHAARARQETRSGQHRALGRLLHVSWLSREDVLGAEPPSARRGRAHRGPGKPQEGHGSLGWRLHGSLAHVLPAIVDDKGRVPGARGWLRAHEVPVERWHPPQCGTLQDECL